MNCAGSSGRKVSPIMNRLLILSFFPLPMVKANPFHLLPKMGKIIILLVLSAGSGRKQKMNNSIKLAKLWVELEAVKTKLDNELIPVSGHLDIDDDELKDSMMQLSKAIQAHLNQFELNAEKIKENKS
jgi:hypothetical protein